MTLNLDALHQAKAASKAEFSRAAHSRNEYERYLLRGKEFLAELVAEWRKVEAEKGEHLDDGINTDELEWAFNEKQPNKCSPVALEYFITQKCFTEDLGKPTVEGIYSAFCDYWDNMWVPKATYHMNITDLQMNKGRVTSTEETTDTIIKQVPQLVVLLVQVS